MIFEKYKPDSGLDDFYDIKDEGHRAACYRNVGTS